MCWETAGLVMEVGRRTHHVLGPAAVVAGGGASALVLAQVREAHSTAELVVLLLAGWSFIGSGVGLWTRRPENRTGPLLILVGLTFLIEPLRLADQPLESTVGTWVSPLHLALFVLVLLAFPSGRLESTPARVVVVATFADLVLLFHVPLLIDDVDVARSLTKASFGVGAVVFFSAALLLPKRWLGGSSAWRRAVAPVLWPGAISLAALGYYDASAFFTDSVGPVPIWVFRIAFALIPFAFLAVLLRVRLARASVAELVVELGKTMTSGALRDALARALGDPSASVAYWLPDERRYVDALGHTMELPHRRERRVATLVEREGRRVAAIVHDEALTEDPGLLRAVSAAAALALDHERLQVELRARLDDLDASRARIIEVAARERKRIERNLHDGTQQRLTSVSLTLGLAESQLATDPGAARASLDQARQVLAAALAELRDLSQGIHPNVLTDGGLGPALEDLAYTAPLPVRVVSTLDQRLPERVEEGAYYVVAESITNVAKHAGACAATVSLAHHGGRLVLSVCDDGVGGADLGHGSGLRGLADRVHALGGTFAVGSRPGHGTEVRAVIPCA
ncbi:MAG: histidine kinase [Acidimicrobiia bacterium]|nr:histidine kinase [Acidimicrobiia bacterium]